MTMTKRNLKNFLGKIDKKSSKNFYKKKRCWEWRASTNKDGYGNFRIGLKMDLSHRVSWIIFNGEIPDGLYVLHYCDNRKCVNPSHLFLGSQKDNMDDMIKKGRENHSNPARGDNNGSRTHPEKVMRGESNGMAKLTSEDVMEIRKRYAEENISQMALGKIYNISQGETGRIIRKERWNS